MHAREKGFGRKKYLVLRMPLGAQASRLRPSQFWLRMSRGRDAHAPRGCAMFLLTTED